ncbi:MAG: hypothetical protein IPH97_13435 [Ignavibacteriales bacterium]|nr:hypothetical protein [Ignavibacteriales bacterium]
MKDILENKHTMYKAVVSLLDGNTAKLSPIPALAPAITSFKDLVTAIKDKDTLANTAGEGLTQTKTADEAALISDAVTIASALSALGSATNDDRLKALSHVTKSSLKSLRDTQLAIDVKNIKTLAESKLGQITAYGITPPMIAALDTKITKFESSTGTSQVGAAVSTTAFKQLDTLFDQADAILKEQIDKTMEIFRTTDPQFYGEYKSSREIKDLGHRFKKPETPVNPS